MNIMNYGGCMQEDNKQAIEMINGQIIALLLFIVSFCISILLAYNEKLKLEGKEVILSDEAVEKIVVGNRILSFLLVAYFAYTFFQTFGKEEITEDDILSAIATVLALIAASITLFVTIKGYEAEPNDADFNPEMFENPEL